MKKFSYILLGISFLILLLVLAIFVFSNRVLHEQDFYASVEISDKGPGFDVGSNDLTFGRISKLGGSSTRNVLFDNGYDFPVRVEIDVEGDINPLLNFEESFIYDIGESGEIPFSVSAFDELDYGFYDGIVKIRVKRA